MTLCDAGPLVALVDRSETSNHERCNAVLPQLPAPLLTTWACFTEAIYFLGDRGGLSFQRLLWRYVLTAKLRIHNQTEAEAPRLLRLMETYHDQPMDFPDAMLVSAAEVLNVTSIFTLDSHFHAYRIHGKSPFVVLP
jgi:uncharacterized protein